MVVTGTQQVGVTEIQNPDKSGCTSRCRNTDRAASHEHPSDSDHCVHTPYHRVDLTTAAVLGARRQLGTIQKATNKVATTPITSGNPCVPHKSMV